MLISLETWLNQSLSSKFAYLYKFIDTTPDCGVGFKTDFVSRLVVGLG